MPSTQTIVDVETYTDQRDEETRIMFRISTISSIGMRNIGGKTMDDFYTFRKQMHALHGDTIPSLHHNNSPVTVTSSTLKSKTEMQCRSFSDFLNTLLAMPEVANDELLLDFLEIDPMSDSRLLDSFDEEDNEPISWLRLGLLSEVEPMENIASTRGCGTQLHKHFNLHQRRHTIQLF